MTAASEDRDLDRVPGDDAPYADGAQRKPWAPPTFKVFNVRDTEAGVNSTDDGGGFS